MNAGQLEWNEIKQLKLIDEMQWKRSGSESMEWVIRLAPFAPHCISLFFFWLRRNNCNLNGLNENEGCNHLIHSFISWLSFHSIHSIHSFPACWPAVI